MEDKKKHEKLSYEELEKAASELHQNYQRLMAEYRKAMEALNSKDFDYTSFFLSALFKVMEHPEHYSDKFVPWVVENIEAALHSFSDSMQAAAEKASEEEKDEA